MELVYTMRAFVLLSMVVYSSCSCAQQQDEYHIQLSGKIQEIKSSDHFNNGVVTYDNSGSYGVWEPDLNFYTGDRTQFMGSTYEAITDSKGKDPADSPHNWVLMSGPHPYLFLKYKARVEDLDDLKTTDDPYLRTYAFTALAYRKQKGLFELVIDNLKDTTRIMQFTWDYGFTVCPGDLMIIHSVYSFTKEQKDSLKELIFHKYNHLNTMDDIMLFHPPIKKDYLQVRKIVKGKRKNAFGYADAFDLVALARYRKQEDIDLILTGFTDIQYYNGFKLFFKAIEVFPDPSFKVKLIEYGKQLKKTTIHDSLEGDQYFFNSLSAYHDKECFDLLSGMADQLFNLKRDKNSYRDLKTKNLQVIHRALKKYADPMYADLIRKIERKISKKADTNQLDYQLEDSVWNY